MSVLWTSPKCGAPQWRAIFGNDHPVEIEIGPGTGTFLIWIAEREPNINYFAIERAWRRHRHLQERLDKRVYPNVRLVAGDAACIVENLVAHGSVAAFHIYFPDPWWKKRHQPRRLLTPALAQTLHRTLADDGAVYFASDVELVDGLARAAFLGSGLFELDPERRSPRSVQTSFERKGLARGHRIYDAVFIKRL